MSKENKAPITLNIKDITVQFAPTLVAYNKFLNESVRDENIVGAVSTYLKRIAVPESRENLAELLQTPGMAAAIAKKVNEIYAPEVEIEVKE
ncbi:putative phage tail assembly chaperone [Yersinia kristensenii]|uniref:putative phage tail assembly chaperone n=1 Tax=Yersinia kristensenii TaxID=28152 RepID=UPI002853738C|nr:putative phage tail assembly chaperone [Yersinia kristensenii]MDR4895237.1 putative phage tail assembly chaperone [Yersinia kristensenii]MDX6737835.1 putative phage tail assembly chaperone [Yersinia kristensenii]